MNTRALQTLLTASGLAFAATACNNVILPVDTTTGSLTIVVEGLPVGGTALVTVSGPSATQTIAATSTLNRLTVGTYTVAASTVLVGSVSYLPVVPSRTVTVTAGETQTISVQYAGNTAAADALTALTASVSPTSISVGQTANVLPAPTLANAGVSVTYSFVSSNTAVASVSSTGVVTALSVGTSAITVTGTGSGIGLITTQRITQATVTVTGGTNALTNLDLAPSTATVTPGSNVTLNPTPTVAGAGVTVTYTFASGSPNVASVNAATGVVTGVSPGTATVTVTATGSGVGFTSNQRTAQATIIVAAATNCVWCNATLAFDANAVPSGWQQAKFGPNAATIANGRIEATATDRGIAFRADGAPPAGTKVIQIVTEGPMADVLFGMQNVVRLETGTTSWSVGLTSYTCTTAAGCGPPSGLPNQLVLSSSRLDGFVFPGDASSSTDFSRQTATYASGTILKVTRQYFDDSAVVIIRRLSDDSPIASRRMPLTGFRIANVTGAGFHFYFTSGSSLATAWLDNIAFSFLSAPSSTPSVSDALLSLPLDLGTADISGDGLNGTRYRAHRTH